MWMQYVAVGGVLVVTVWRVVANSSNRPTCAQRADDVDRRHR